jgi:hypothetical protein
VKIKSRKGIFCHDIPFLGQNIARKVGVLPDLEHLLLQVANRQQDYKFILPSYLSCSQTHGCQRGYTTRMKKRTLVT